MRKALGVSLAIAFGLLGVAVALILASQPQPSAYRYNPYYPYSVETSIRDK